MAFKADLSNRTEIDRLVSAAFGHFGSIDILVNNAGVEKKAPFWAVTEESGDSRFERPADRAMAVGNPPLPALWPIWRVLIGGPVFSKYGSLPLTIYVQYAFINALAKLANEWCAL